MIRFILTGLFIAACFGTHAAENDSTNAARLSASLSFGYTLKANKNQVLDVKLPLSTANIRTAILLHMNPGRVLIGSYDVSTYSNDGDFYSTRYTNRNISLAYGLEGHIRKAWLRNEFGFGVSSYEFILLSRTDPKPVDSLYDKFEYAANKLMSADNFFLTYGTTLGIFDLFNGKMKFNVAQHSSFFIKSDEIFNQNLASRFSICLSVGLKVNLW